MSICIYTYVYTPGDEFCYSENLHDRARSRYLYHARLMESGNVVELLYAHWPRVSEFSKRV